MHYLVVEKQVTNVTFKYTDLAQADFDIAEPPFEDEGEARACQEREYPDLGVVIAVPEEYIESYPGDLQ
jgi:hypothetical protein